MSEGVGRSGIGEIVRRDVDRLEGGDRTILGGGDSLLEISHLGGKGGLVTDGAGRTAKKRRDLGSRLRETEDVIDEEENVLVLLVAEILGHGEGGQGHAETRSGRLVHLTVDETYLRPLLEENEIAIGILDGMTLLVLLDGDDSGLDHFTVEIVTLAGTLTNACKEGVTSVSLGDVVDEFHDDDGLADTGTAECADLTTLGEGTDKIDDLDTGLKDLGLGVLIDERRCVTVNRELLFGLDRSTLIGGLTEDVEDAAEDTLADRNRNGGTETADGHPALESLRGGHGDGANPVLTEVLLDLKGHLGSLAVDRVVDLEGVIDLGQGALLGVELGVNDRSDDLNDGSCVAHALLGVWCEGVGGREINRAPSGPL